MMVLLTLLFISAGLILGFLILFTILTGMMAYCHLHPEDDNCRPNME